MILENLKEEMDNLLKNNPYLKNMWDKNKAYKSNLTNLISEMNKELGVTITNTVGYDEMFHLKVSEFRDENGNVFFKCAAPSSVFSDVQDWEENMVFTAKIRYQDIYPTKLESDN